MGTVFSVPCSAAKTSKQCTTWLVRAQDTTQFINECRPYTCPIDGAAGKVDPDRGEDLPWPCAQQMRPGARRCAPIFCLHAVTRSTIIIGIAVCGTSRPSDTAHPLRRS